MTTPKRAAYYCRVSTDDQVLNYGLDVQASDCERYAAARGYEIVDRFVDEGFSGADDIDDRPELQRALIAVAAREFDVLMVPMYDRLARSLEVALEILPLLLKSKVTLVEVRTEQEFKGLGSLVGLIALWGAADEHKKILDRTKKGHIRRAKSKKVAGPPAFGYDRTEDGGLVVNQEEAEIVREIFRLYLDEQYGVDKIAALLNARGIQTKRAKENAKGKTKFRGADRWQRSTILCMFRNPVYKGEYVYGKTHGKVPAGREYRPDPKRPVKSKDVRRALRNREHNPHEQVTIEVPAIVEAETWERVQALKAERAESGPIKRLNQGATKYTYNFPTLIRCHECKRVMTPWKHPFSRKRDGTKGIRGYYVCRNQDLPCVNLNKYHDLHSVDFAIVHRLLPFLRDPELTRDGLSEAIRLKKQEHDILASQARGLMAKKEEAGRKLDRLLDEFAGGTGITADKVRARCADLEREMEECDEALKRLQGQLDDLSYHEDHQKIETVVSLFHQIATFEYPADMPGLPTLEAIWWGRDPEAWEEPGPLHELSPDHALVKIVNSLVKYVTIGLNSEIIDYRLRITPRPVEMLPPPPDHSVACTTQRVSGSRATPIGQPEPVTDATEDDGNYKAKRNSITSHFRIVQRFEWALLR